MADLDDLSALLGQFSALSGGSKAENQNESGGSAENIFGDLDIDMIMKLMDAFSRLNSSDKNTELLLALKPHLRDENQGKVDRAIKLMKMMSVFMLLKDSGIADKLF